jgi:glycosyltransferase involved in cell wall biosynthesis
MAFTGKWPGYAAGFEHRFQIETVGATQHLTLWQGRNGYSVGFSLVSPAIALHLWRYRPDVVFANAFSLWTMIAIVLKFWLGYRLIITYEGGSPTYESAQPSLRLGARRWLARWADGFVVNSRAGQQYFTQVLSVPSAKILQQPFLVPSLPALSQGAKAETPTLPIALQHPVFLYVGQLIARKGCNILLEACTLLRQRHQNLFTLLIVGDGEQRPTLHAYATEHNLHAHVHWLGQVEYQCLGAYFELADVFVFPTHEDIWGMVLTEAMAFGKPVICSQAAGAAEMVCDRSNGFLYDPTQPSQLADLMQRFLEEPELIQQMGAKSAAMMAQHTPADAIQSFIQAAL